MNEGEIHTRPEPWPEPWPERWPTHVANVSAPEFSAGIAGSRGGDLALRDDKMTRRPNPPVRRLNSVPCAPIGLTCDNQCIDTRWGLD